MNNYQSIYQQSINYPEKFWAKAAQELHWDKAYDKVLDDSDKPFYRWFTGGELNICYNAIDRHVIEGYGEQTAIIYDSPVSNTKARISYAQLKSEIAKLAYTMQSLGVNKGDTVIIYMPMIPEAIVSMLACARIGALHSVVFGGFAANELAVRINDAKPKLILSASCGIEVNRIIHYKPLLDEALSVAKHKVGHTLIKQRPEYLAALIEGRDYDWDELTTKAEEIDCVRTAATDPLYILYTSGTTGQPKGIVRDHGGQAVSLKWTMKNIYDSAPGEVYWAASDVGWIVGHSYIVYAPLLNRNTTVIYEGKPVGTPDAGAFWRVIEEYKVNTLFTAPTALRVIKKEDPRGDLPKQYDLSSLRSLFLAGERTDPDTVHWAEANLQIPIIDHWWQTETSWAIVGNPLGIEKLPIKIGSSSKPIPGYFVQVLDEQGNEKPHGELGNLAIKLPLPPGTLVSLWQNKERFFSSYLEKYPGYYLSGDSGLQDEDGYIFIMSRIDDVINTAGHRLSTGQMEEILCDHPEVAEAATFGVKDDIKGELPLALVVCNSQANSPKEDLCQQLIQCVRDKLGPVAAFKLVAVVSRLPKTRSGKILRATMRSIANGEEWKMPATIDDPAILDEISEHLKSLGYPK